MSHCLEGCCTCQDEMQHERTIACVTTTRIRAIHMGDFPVLVEETLDEDDYVPEGVNTPEGGVNSDPDDLPGLCAVDDKDMDDPEIEDEDRIFVAHVHSADPDHFKIGRAHV